MVGVGDDRDRDREVGTGRAALEAEFDLPFTWLDTEESEGEVFWIDAADLPR